MTSRGGVLGQEGYSSVDTLMYKYIEDNLDAPDNHRSVGVISFEYFLKLYKTALIWNRVQFAERKQLIITQRRKALQDNDM